MAYCSRVFLLDPSMTSPLGAGAQSDSERASIRGARDSIDCLFALVRWRTSQRCIRWTRKGKYTSQFSRIKQRPPATDLSGPKASAVSLTPRSMNLAPEEARDLMFDLVSLASFVLGSTVGFEGPECPSPTLDWKDVVRWPVSCESVLAGWPRRKRAPYCSTPDCEWSRDQTSAKSRHRYGGLELIP